MKVLVTGTEGYIGARLAPWLTARGHDVVGLDTGYYRDGTLYLDPISLAQLPRTVLKDLRTVTPEDFEGFDAVVHLAELSNDPLGQNRPEITFNINHEGSVRIARAAQRAGVRRFIYASSCSVYGIGSADFVDETSPVNPQTAYAKCKTLVERDLRPMASRDFGVVFLRNATAYGASPRLRLDIVVNNLTAVAMTTGEVRLQSDGTPWRPLVHIEDISRSFLAMLEAPRELVHDEAFNVGRSQDNVQVRDIAEMVRDAVPGSTLSIAAGAGPDLRDYRVDFAKLTDTFPELALRWNVRKGIDELAAAYAKHGLSYDDFTSPRFVRLRRIRELLSAGLLDEMLHRTTGAPFPPPGAVTPPPG